MGARAPCLGLREPKAVKHPVRLKLSYIEVHKIGFGV